MKLQQEIQPIMQCNDKNVFFNISNQRQNEKGKEKKKNGKNLTLPHWDSSPRFLNKTFPSKI